MNKVTKKHLKRKIVIDEIGTFRVVGELTKDDLILLVCFLDEDMKRMERLLGLDPVKPLRKF